jgi:hypothetical protein
VAPRAKRKGPARRKGSTSQAAQAAAAPPVEPWLSPAAQLALASGLVVLFLFWLRWRDPAPRDYDEYYHLALAREMWSGLRIREFWWTPFSTMYDRFVDGAPLFHILLMPFARLPLERAALLGTLLGQLFAVGSFAWVLHSMRVPRPWLFVLAFPAVGTVLLQRLEMCRPHVWLIGFALLVFPLLAARRWKTLALVCALFGLTHTGGWIAIAIAAAWTVLGALLPDERREGEPRFAWQPIAATAGGWLLGQLVHPEVPANFRLLFVSNFVIPFQATSTANTALRRELGTELAPPSARILFEQWPAFVVAGLVVAALALQPRLRRRGTLTVALFAVAFLLVGAVLMRRFLELGAPLALIALALAARDWRDEDLPRPLPGWGGTLAGVGLLAATLSTTAANSRYDIGKWSPPRKMAVWLGNQGARGERVFTAQWADSGPLFYSAPQLQSLFALDPTAFATKDPALFALYSDIVRSRTADPIRAIRERFGARWVTVWKAYPRFGMQLQRRHAPVAYSDEDYVIFDLATPGTLASPDPGRQGRPPVR